MRTPALAVDAGQTEVRAVVVDGHEAVATGPGVQRIGAVDADAVADAILAVTGSLRALPSSLGSVAVGLSGFEAAAADDLERIAARLRDALSPSGVVLASDGVTALLGALGDRSGAVIAAGTGTIVVARGRGGWARVDGWGSLLGDAGSGFAIGRAGLDAALRELDGRGGSGALLHAARGHFEEQARAAEPPRESGSTLTTPAAIGPDAAGAALVAAVHGSPVPTRAVAGFATVVGRLAAQGDEASLAILADAAGELARSAAAALDRALAPEEPAVVSYAGNVFRAGQLLLEPLARALAAGRRDVTLVAPAGDALDGAVALAGAPAAIPEHGGLLWRAQ